MAWLDDCFLPNFPRAPGPSRPAPAPQRRVGPRTVALPVIAHADAAYRNAYAAEMARLNARRRVREAERQAVEDARLEVQREESAEEFRRLNALSPRQQMREILGIDLPPGED
jgi:hypothetical protein